MKWWQIVLFPFTILYDLITRSRNYLYHIGYKKSFSFPTNVVAVGNLSAGGTGKTPMVIYLADYFLCRGKSVAILSRGYGRRTSGFRVCTEVDSPKTVGDEPYMYFERYGGQVTVAVGERRAAAASLMLAKNPGLDVILLDDAFQHRSVKPDFNILLTTAQRPFWQDYVLPSGLLREARKGAGRADCVIVTKSTREEEYEPLRHIRKPYFQTRVDYVDPILFSGEKLRKEVVVVAGVADNRPFVAHVSAKFNLKAVFLFADHHAYNPNDAGKIAAALSGEVSLLTTHKDAVKLRTFEALKMFSCAYIPIRIKFLKEEERFLQLLDERLRDYRTHS